MIQSFSGKEVKFMNFTPEHISKMFDEISDRYDKLNNIISIGFDKHIKKICINILNVTPENKVIDLCTGTGDIAGLVYKKTEKITGVDFSGNMLRIAKIKYPQIQFLKSDVTNLPFKNESFDIATITYGLRNIPDKVKAIEEIHRILKPNGKILHLDFGDKNFAGKIFDIYVPILAKIFNTNIASYKYLVKSKQNFLTPEEIEKIFTENGFELISKKYFMFKAIACQIFAKKTDE